MRHVWISLLLLAPCLLVGCGTDKPLSPVAQAAHRTTGPEAMLAPGKPGSITIVLDIQPDDPTDVTFVTQGRKLQSFALDDDGDASLPNARTFDHLKPGTYVIEEMQAPVGTLAQITGVSTGGTENNAIDLANHTATINLEPGESVTCTFRVGWADGDMVTYAQNSWGDQSTQAGGLLAGSFDTVYPSGLELGIPGDAGHSMLFFDSPSLFNYLPAGGQPGALDADYVNPTSTSSGLFGGVVAALRLNVDFSDARITLGQTGISYGDLRLCHLDLPLLDGLTVRQYLAVVNTALGGGSYPYPYTIEQLSNLTFDIDLAFQAGVPTQFARDHFFIGDCP